jgi:hypothetical protein
VSVSERRASFRELHRREELFVLRNHGMSFRAIARDMRFPAARDDQRRLRVVGKLDQRATSRRARRGHFAAAERPQRALLPGRSWRDRPDRRLARKAGPLASRSRNHEETGRIDDVGLSPNRVTEVVEASGDLVLSGRPENHLRGVRTFSRTRSRASLPTEIGRGRAIRPRADRSSADPGGRGSRRARSSWLHALASARWPARAHRAAPLDNSIFRR